MKYQSVKILALSIIIFFSFHSLAETITLASQYAYAPWSSEISGGKDLNGLLATKLNEIAAGKYTFKSSSIPRKRIDAMLARGESVVVPWVHPRFFDDAKKIKFLWSEPLLNDIAYYISPVSAPFEYSGPESLIGKHFSGTIGHIYTDIDPLVAAGKMSREDAPTLKESLLKLVAKRNLDLAVVDRSTLEALKSDFFIDPKKIHLAKTLRTPIYPRSILVPKNHPEWIEFLNKAIVKLKNDKEWQAEIEKYDAKN